MATLFKIRKVWYLNYSVNGKRVRQKIGRDRKTAELALKDVEVKLARHQIGLVDRHVRLADYLEEFREYLQTNKAPQTVSSYENSLRHLLRFLDEAGVRYIENVTPRHLEAYKTFRLNEQISPRTVNKELRTISHFFVVAKRFRYVDSSPMTEVKELRVPPRPPRFFSKEEENLILANTNGYRDAYEFLLHTGLRSGEILTLEWADVNLRIREMRISPKDSWTPKTDSSSRVVPLNQVACRILKGKSTDTDRVFLNQCGDPVKGLSQTFSRLLTRLEIRNASLHTFRHTFASRLVMAGIDLPTVQQLLGHRNIQTTMIYAHLAPDHLKQAVEVLTNLGQTTPQNGGK